MPTQSSDDIHAVVNEGIQGISAIAFEVTGSIADQRQ